ncbi:hypothetical protein pb186bvf_000548 [Paramecium bursaria]
MNIIQNISVNQAEPTLTSSQISKLKSSRVNIYDRVKSTILTSDTQTLKIGAKSPPQKRNLIDIRHPRELDSVIKTLLIPCKHNNEWCPHDQLFEKNQNGKTLRQLCEFRADWCKQLLHLEKDYQNYLCRRSPRKQQFYNEDYLENKEKNKKKLIPITDMIEQFEQVQRKHKFTQLPSFWQFIDCSTCNVNN